MTEQTTQTPAHRDGPTQPPGDGPGLDRVLDRLRQVEGALVRQGRRAAQIQNGFAIFAVLALVLSLMTFLAVAFKLDRKASSAPVAAAGAAPPAAALRATSAASRTVGFTLREFTIAPGRSTAPAGRVTFRVRNAGRIAHELVVIRTPRPARSLPLRGGTAVERGSVGESGILKPGQSRTLRLTLKPGHFALICNLPGHYTAGQHADFTAR